MRTGSGLLAKQLKYASAETVSNARRVALKSAAMLTPMDDGDAAVLQRANTFAAWILNPYLAEHDAGGES
jgi:hypothetical protein